jgi:anti-sigma factor RsiW
MHANPNRQTIDCEVLDRYLAGESSAEELGAVDAWLAAHPDQATRLVHSSVLSRDRMDADWARIVARLGNRAPGLRPQVRQTWRRGHQPGGRLVGGTLQWVVRMVCDRFAGNAMAALFGRKVTTLTTAELERLRDLVKHAESEDE